MRTTGRTGLATIDQRPTLFEAALYGNPNRPEELEWILGYSPYQKIEPGQRYPAVFLTTGAGDDRVPPAHAWKMAASSLRMDRAKELNRPSPWVTEWDDPGEQMAEDVRKVIDVVIVGAARTPIGAFQGGLAPLTAPQLGAIAIRAALERSGVKPEAIDEVVMGCVLQAGLGQAPARQAAIFGGIPDTVPAVTLNKVCGSGLKAVIAGAQAIALSDAEIVVAGGMESMSNAPYLSHAMRGGARMGNVEMKDAMILDGLWDVYDQVHMGVCAESCAATYKISREAQDAYAIESARRAIKAQKEGLFKEEIVPVSVPARKGEPMLVSEDEGPKNARPERISGLKPVFQKDGTITAANASSINDGAAALVLMSAQKAQSEGRAVLGRIVGYSHAARKPSEFTVAPADAIRKLMARTGLTVSDVDQWEINEAFAVVSLANNQLLGLDPSKVNVRGGAVTLGHPIGASGARLLVTLLHTLKVLGQKRGVASLCIGGGEGMALMVER